MTIPSYIKLFLGNAVISSYKKMNSMMIQYWLVLHIDECKKKMIKEKGLVHFKEITQG